MDQFIGEIRMFGGDYAPDGWALCDGSLLAIGENEALFSLIGTTYGGDGQQSFQLPDLRGRIPVHVDAGSGYILGGTGGVEKVTLTRDQLPEHTHPLEADTSPATTGSPESAIFAHAASEVYGPASALVAMNQQAIQPAGGGQSHDNVQPFLSVNFIIATVGMYPQRD